MELQSLLFRAMQSEHGIIVKTSNPTNLRAKLYPLRKADPMFECLAFVIPPVNTDSTLWIVKKTGDPNGS